MSWPNSSGPTCSDPPTGGLTPLFWGRIRPYGEVRLDLASRLLIGGATA
ncbi:hypothetical protein [Streptomyces sp. NPDC048527]